MSRLALAAVAASALLGVSRMRAAAPARAVPLPAQASQTVQDDPARLPFGVGERAQYDVKFGAVRVGNGTMEVVGIDTVRGRDVFHTQFRVRGGTFFYRVNDLFESWFDTRTLASMRFVSDQQEGGRDREKHYEIYPDRSVFVERGREGEQASVSLPLDDGSFIYFVRTVPLVVGSTYEFNRYFRPDRNPVRLQVLRRERVRVPAGTFDCVVVRPIIKTRGIFSENGHAEVWIAADSTRVMVQMKSRLSFGSLNLYLKTYRPPTEAGTGTR